ncbi:MAG TPA: BON domain-containing protein [Gammaproteobacteria bacterium]|nr:BON domain-containing protein [Gammaproteobacteria bacterium]
MKKAMLFMVLLAVVLQGCGAMLVGGAATGAAVIHDRRSAGAVLDDKNLQFKIHAAVSSDAELSKHTNLSVTSYNYAVLLTGQAENSDYRERLVEVARNTPLVKRVIDQIEIGASSSLSQEAHDAYLTAKVKLELLNISLPSFDPTRVKVVTELNVVYLMGLVTQEEAAAVVEKARYIKGVERVVKIFEYI